MLLCAHHHRLVHEEGWKVEWWGEDRPSFTDPRGQMHGNGRPAGRRAPADLRDPVQVLVNQTRCRGAHPDYLTAGARWKREDDIPDDVYFMAREALG